MRSLLLSVVLWLLTIPVAAQTVTMPQSVPVAVGRLAAVEMSFDGTDFRYSVPPELDAFREFTTDPKAVRLRVIGYTPGMFRIVAVTCKDDKLSEFASCVVIVGQTPQPGVPTATITAVPSSIAVGQSSTITWTSTNATQGVLNGALVNLSGSISVQPSAGTHTYTFTASNAAGQRAQEIATLTVGTLPVPTDKATAVVLIYEKDQHVVWPAVMSALNRLNRERGIIATTHEVDTKSGAGKVPEQYREAVPAAISAGLPALVVMAGVKALKVVKNPTTEAAVWEAVP